MGGTIMKYTEIRSYSNHLISDELYDRIGFLLNKLSILQQQQYQKQFNDNNDNGNINKLFLCGMRECLKALRNTDINVIGVIISSQMEPLPESRGLDKMIDQIKHLCKQRKIEIIYALNRKQL